MNTSPQERNDGEKKSAAQALAKELGLGFAEQEGNYEVFIHPSSPHRIGYYTSLFRGSIGDALHYLERAAKGVPHEGRHPNTWVSEVPPQTTIWHEGKYDESMGNGKVVAKWEQDESTLYVATEGFLSVGMDTHMEVSWLSATGDVRATSSVEDDFLPFVLRSNDGRGPNKGDKLQIHRRYTPADHEKKSNITVTVELA